MQRVEDQLMVLHVLLDSFELKKLHNQSHQQVNVLLDINALQVLVFKYNVQLELTKIKQNKQVVFLVHQVTSVKLEQLAIHQMYVQLEVIVLQGQSQALKTFAQWVHTIQKQECKQLMTVKHVNQDHTELH